MMTVHGLEFGRRHYLYLLLDGALVAQLGIRSSPAPGVPLVHLEEKCTTYGEARS